MEDNRVDCIAEGRDDVSVWFILPNQELFYQTGYKVLQGRDKKGFIRCYRLTYNGKVKLTYDISDKKTLEALIPELSSERLAAVLLALFQTVTEVGENGFIRCESIIAACNKIFIDANDGVGLIYLPIKQEESGDGYPGFENRLRRELAVALRSGRGILDGLMTEVCSELEDSAYTLQEIGKALSGEKEIGAAAASRDKPAQGKAEAEKTAKKAGGFLDKLRRKKDEAPPPRLEPEKCEFHPELVLVATAPESLRLIVSKPQFLIGKNPHAADGLIESCNAVSRLHCKVEWQPGGYTLTDVGSVNGTFLNEIRLTNGVPVGIKPGDEIRIATVAFKVQQI